jgi:hypothetical protein
MLGKKDTHPHILVGTPGRINALVRDKHLRLANVKYFAEATSSSDTMPTASNDDGTVDGFNIWAQFDGFNPDPHTTFKKEFHRATFAYATLALALF